MSPQEKMERPRPRTIRPASAFHGFPPGALVPGQAPPGVVPVMMPSPPRTSTSQRSTTTPPATRRRRPPRR